MCNWRVWKEGEGGTMINRKLSILKNFPFGLYNSNDDIEEYQIQIQLLQRSP